MADYNRFPLMNNFNSKDEINNTKVRSNKDFEKPTNLSILAVKWVDSFIAMNRKFDKVISI